MPSRAHHDSIAALAACGLATTLPACADSKPADAPESTASSSEAQASPPPAAKTADPGAPATPPSEPGSPPPEGPVVPKGMAMDTYEMTPSDCDALGRHYGEVARSDQVSQLSPKLNEKQRSATMDQIDKVVSKLEESWTGGCQSTLVNKAVDHDAIKCALAAKSVHAFDVCINGPSGTPQPQGKGKKK
jgi:hypothetical protein